MIVSELIEQLTKLPQDALVLTRGYESGYDASKHVFNKMVHDTRTRNSYDGQYDYNWLDKSNIVDDINAVIIDSCGQ